ncbi:ATP binding protein [Aspergillus heteromorphus CBS 117.55]|uniref:ATP binding protein n=1 Tax=Aspergillus heteromorphus CBS 117.55 TaxID=1448321 RepID=A0A317WWR6_9EURO|nr:ATP binding protein [Aspergillus heteromorphus CBS 117.55]PWY90834.1 ATP binding protein [Aspergillus heteromorphus CBS 117.55]
MNREGTTDFIHPELLSRLSAVHLEKPVLVNKDIKAYLVRNYPEGSERWLLKPEVPPPAEIMGAYDFDDADDDEKYVDLRPNQIVGPWESKEAYLKAHYELLREDSIAPLRDAVAYVREDPQMMDNNVASIYDKVYITGITFAQRGLGFRIQFSTSRAGKSIAWEYSKRLISGSVVALSPADDVFKSKCVIAIVAARPLETVTQYPSEIDIFFTRPEDVDFDPQKEWIMVEAKDGYYESARHTMTALQKMSQEQFPLSEHICLLNPNVQAPDYVKEHPIVDIQSAIDGTSQEGKVNILEDWPHLPTADLDHTQWDALREMLTKQLSVIQGPPGTGKTYVSVLALKILLSNMKPGDPPIIIASQTNHALDQILRLVSTFERSYIRLGSRSSDPEIKRRTLYSVRQSGSTVPVHGSVLGSARKDYKNLSRGIFELLQPFSADNADVPLPAFLFVKYGLMTETQYDSLIKGAKGWVRASDAEDTDPLVAWLGEELIPFEVGYAAENFGFAEDDIDLEYEQLKELEAEQGIEEDDYEILKGQFVGIRDGFCGRSASYSETSALEYLKHTDLWKIKREARGSVYDVLRKQLKLKIMGKLRSLMACYFKNCESLQIGKWERDYHILGNAKVIGMTATGLSKYRGLISSLQPRIVLIEEAAEAIEAPLTAACFNSLQHMILVGDHQQLKGHCTVQELESAPFNLGVSMFERLVKNGIRFVTLKRQRRMAPEIRQLLEPIYGTLQDHQSRKRILSALKQQPYIQGNYVKVVTVDSYQGEENEIVILSLVRSGGGHIGFLSIENRVCVALSRARRGFYMFGNATALVNGNLLWQKVLTTLESSKPRRLRDVIPVTCAKHKRWTPIKGPPDWEKINGGCDLPCDEALDCGHPCPILCHRFSHDQVRCDNTCGRRMACNHICETPCATSHTCSCKCDLGQRLENEGLVIGTMLERPDPYTEAVKQYQEFASGGAQEHDAFMLRKAQAIDATQALPAGPGMIDDLLLDYQPNGRPERPEGREKAATSTRASVPQGNLLDD